MLRVNAFVEHAGTGVRRAFATHLRQCCQRLLVSVREDDDSAAMLVGGLGVGVTRLRSGDKLIVEFSVEK